MTENAFNQKKPNDFAVNELDNVKEHVRRIYYKTPEYVVYRTDKALRVDIDDESPNVEIYRANHNAIAVELARIYSYLPEKLTWSEPINRQIARSIVQNIAGNHEESKNMLEHAESRIKSLRVISGRLQYTLSSFACVGLCFVVMIILDGYCVNGIGNNFSYCLLSKITFFGALGGMISVSLGFPKLNIDLDASIFTNCLIGLSRIIISMAAAIFAYFAIDSGVAFSFINSIENNSGLYVASMVAGFSEMLVPNIMTNFSKPVKE